MELPTMEQLMLRLLKQTAVEIRPCKACGQTLYFVQHNNGKRAPYTAEGLNHFINCPEANQFRKDTNAVKRTA